MYINPTTPHGERLRAARAALAARFPYLYPIVYLLTLVETDRLQTMAVDRHARLYYNPCFLDALTDTQVVGLLWHEVHHLLREHPGPRGENLHQRHPYLSKIALDLEINDDAQTAGVDLPRGNHPYAGHFPEMYGFPTGLLAEEYLKLLLGFPPEKRPKTPQEHGTGAGGDPGDWELGNPSPSTGGVEGANLEVARQATAQAIRDYEAKGRGTVPAGVRRWAEAYLNPKVDWRSVLRNTLRKSLADLAARQRATYTRPHRRASTYHPVILPGTYGLKPRVAVVIDTSGSMDEELLGQALAEVQGILQRVKEVRVYTVDAAVHTAQKVFRKEQINLLGGGGTDITLGIHAALAHKPPPDLIVALTDGLTPWPTSPTPVPLLAVLLQPHAPTPPPWIRTIVAS
ncbi:vWA domain-containing protein [Thermus caldilimi]|uniref:vWA domain-containing protein n=1 Tax=Thermus caldilimi TaxID=2483360 RepID=UPI0010763C3D|nr:VWA-like domain-containing protein [Thermus caldilimi]